MLQTPPPDPTTNAFFYAGTGMLLCRCDDKVILFDVQQRVAVAEMPTPSIKYVAWNADMSVVALLSKHAIVVADSKLKSSCTVHETIRVKSAAWSDSGVLIYTTLNHIKYCLPNGDSGIVRTLDTPVYIVSVIGNTIHALDREGKMRQIQVSDAIFHSTQMDEKLARSSLRPEQFTAYRMAAEQHSNSYQASEPCGDVVCNVIPDLKADLKAPSFRQDDITSHPLVLHLA